MTFHLLLVMLAFNFFTQFIFALGVQRSIPKLKFKLLMLNMTIDLLIAILLSVGIFYHAPTWLLQFTVLLTLLSSLWFFNIYMGIFKDKYPIRRYVAIIFILLIGVFFIYGNQYINDMWYMVIFMISVSILATMLYMKRNYVSRRILISTITLIITEVLRYGILATTAYLIATNNMIESIWLVAVHYGLRMAMIVLMIEIFSHLAIDPKLANVLDFQSAPKLLDLVFSKTPNAVILTTITHKIVYVNEKSLFITGFKAEEVIGKNPRIFASGKTSREVYKNMKKTIGEYKNWEGEFINRKKNGEIFVESVKIVTLFDVDDKPLYYLAIKTDITKEKQYLKELEYTSNFDALTGLLQRHKFLSLIEEQVSQYMHDQYFILFDIDRFKAINDRYGHLVGDEALKHFAAIVKKTFKLHAFYCRFGGDEFAAFVDSNDEGFVLKLLSQLKESLRQMPLTCDKYEIYLETSVGFTKVLDGENFSSYYERADRYLYDAKKHPDHIVKD